MTSTNYTLPLPGQFYTDGVAVVPGLYSPPEIAALLRCLESATGDPSSPETPEVFALRDLMGEVPDLWPLLHDTPLQTLLAHIFPTGCHLVKAIYFDKPTLLSWRVGWHQDLMINVDCRVALPGFGPWTRKAEGVAVQPPAAVLENMCTVRIHLDDCDATNGALNAVPGSHRHGVVQHTNIAPLVTEPVLCEVPAGGAVLMRPLVLHASNRSTGARPRRVIHLEFASVELPDALQWRERRLVQLPASTAGLAPVRIGKNNGHAELAEASLPRN